MSLILISHLRKKAHKIMNWGQMPRSMSVWPRNLKVGTGCAQLQVYDHAIMRRDSFSSVQTLSSQERVIYVEDLPIL